LVSAMVEIYAIVHAEDDDPNDAIVIFDDDIGVEIKIDRRMWQTIQKLADLLGWWE